MGPVQRSRQKGRPHPGEHGCPVFRPSAIPEGSHPGGAHRAVRGHTLVGFVGLGPDGPGDLRGVRRVHLHLCAQRTNQGSLQAPIAGRSHPGGVRAVGCVAVQPGCRTGCDAGDHRSGRRPGRPVSGVLESQTGRIIVLHLCRGCRGLSSGCRTSVARCADCCVVRGALRGARVGRQVGRGRNSGAHRPGSRSPRTDHHSAVVPRRSVFPGHFRCRCLGRDERDVPQLLGHGCRRGPDCRPGSERTAAARGAPHGRHAGWCGCHRVPAVDAVGNLAHRGVRDHPAVPGGAVRGA